MIKVKDGYAKLIGTTYQGSATQVLLSNGGDLEYSASSKASTLVQRNASQHIYATYFNSAISDEALTDIGSVYVRNTSDTFIRRVSKTQFYSILDDKFVTLDTTQSITGAKTFSTSVRFANNASIIQNQNDTSSYTTILKWYKNGASRNTYDPSIGQHNTGGDGNGSICILPYPTETSPWGGMVGLFISKGVLKLDGKSVALAENYYTKTESDERYVNVTGDTMTGPLIVKAAITGTQLISTIATGTSPLKVTSTTVVTNLNSDLLDGLHETSFFRARGDQSIASSVPTTTELATNNNLCGSWNVKYTGASGHLVQFNAGSGSTRYMQFYSMYSGSLYWRNSTDSTLNTKSWKTIVDSANYTGIVLKIGTATKGSATLPIYLNAGTPTACSTTLGVSITGNAATATKLQTARTINGTSFDGTTNIVTAYWGTARTISLSGAVTGSASVNGSQNVTITTTYQFGSIDGRYVGGNKTADHGSSGTAYTADTYSSTFVNKAFVAFAERGSWAYVNNGYVSTDTGVNIPLAGTAIFQWGASDTNKTQLYITPHDTSGVSNPAANEMLFYTSNGSGSTSAWTRVLTHRNYTTYTVTKTGGGASGTWGISITGNAATATKASRLTLVSCYNGTTNNDLWSTIKTKDSTYIGTATIYEVYNDGGPTTYGEVLDIVSMHDNHWQPQLWFDAGRTGSIRHRNKDYNNTTWGSWYTLLDTNNYPGLLDGRYVTLTTAQTISGIKTFSTQQKFTVATGTSPFTVSSTTVVSNLNADLLDGYHAASFYQDGYVMFAKTIDASGLNTSTYYPVTFNVGIHPNVRIECRVSLNSGTKPSWSAHANGFSVRKIWEVNGSGWGTNPVNRRILVSDYAFATADPVRGVGQLTNGSEEYVYVRGGGKYLFYISHNVGATLRTSTYTTYSQSVSPTTSAPAEISTPTLTFTAGRFSALSYKPTTGINTVYIPTNTSHLTNDSGFLTGNVIRAVSANGYWGMARPDSNTSDWIRTTSAGIIPYQSGGRGAGHCGLGTSSWYFSFAYIDTVHGNLDGTATNADKLDGFHANTSQNPFGKIPTIGSNGVMEVGRYLDFHYDSSDTSNYRTRLQINHSSGSYTAILPAKSGTLAMTSDIPTVTNHYWANIKVSSSSSTSTSPTFSTAYTSDWFRSTGDTGWYSQTYGGGWNMTDTTYIRAYGSKRVYTANTEQYAFYTAGGMTAAKGFWHSAVNSNSYVLLAGGSYKNLADFAKGNAGASNRGVYVTNGTVTAMTYYLNATVESGASSRIAYYKDTNRVGSYIGTTGSNTTPIYLSRGIPTACSGVVVKYWGWYTINCYDSTVPSFTKKGGNFNFVSSVSRRGAGRYSLGTVYPSGYTYNNTIYWGSGRLNRSQSGNSSISTLYVTMLAGYQSGSTYYLYVNTSDDDSTNDGSFDVFFLIF